MSSVAIFAVLTAALLHAVSHVFIKLGEDQWLTHATVNLVGLIVAVPLWFYADPFTSFPAGVFLGSALLHQLYKVFVIGAYQSSDLSRVFPIMRGSSPLLVLLGSAIVYAELVSIGQAMGAMTILVGIALLALKDVELLTRSGKGVSYALLAAACTAGYTMLDGVVVRESGSPLRYIASLYIFDGAFFPAVVWPLRRRVLSEFLRRYLAQSIAAGLFAIVSYGTVVYVMKFTPIGLVAVLREVSMIFVAVIGASVIREPLGVRRILASTVVFLGVVTLFVYRS